MGSSSSKKASRKYQPAIISREDHIISRRHISDAALKVLYRLHKEGYGAYLVGGGVRDLLLGHQPKDFDVVTEAHPEEIQKLFRNSYIIGRRFRLVHVRFGREIIEVATFRSSQESSARIKTQDGLLLRDNVYGTLEDDIWRRDFTVNALYYNIADFTVVDFAKGMEDLKNKKIRVIGAPVDRFVEDPARMLRAIRLAGKLDFNIDKDTAEAIHHCRELLTQIPPARLFDKMLKIFHSGKSFQIFELLKAYNFVEILFPKVDTLLQEDEIFKEFVEKAFHNSDARVNEGKGINSAFLFAVLLWGPIQQAKQHYTADEQRNEYQALHLAIQNVLQSQLKIISIPRKFTTVMREIWVMQYHLEHGRARRIYKLLHHDRFRAAYDFLVLRSHLKDVQLMQLSQWWTDFQESDDEQRNQLIKERFDIVKKKRKKKKKRGSDASSLHSVGE